MYTFVHCLTTKDSVFYIRFALYLFNWWSKMVTPNDIGQGLMPIERELKRIATAFEALLALQAHALGLLPPTEPPTKILRTDAKASVVEIDSNKASDDVRGSADKMFYRGSQLFYANDKCDDGCPKRRSCIEYLPGLDCLGWRTARYKGGK